jgi:L-ascorbate metabolism protein UlaG (beta-lactamase superfamily)
MIDEIGQAKVRKGEMRIFWLGQNSFVFKTPQNKLIALDIYLSRDPALHYLHPDPPLRPEDCQFDYLFCTHDHLDHTDATSLPIIAKNFPAAKFFGTPESCEHMINLGIDERRVNSLEARVTFEMDDFKVTPYYSISPDEVSEENSTTHFGYLFDIEAIRIYNMGDSSRAMLENPTEVLEPVAKASPHIAMFPILSDLLPHGIRKPEDAVIFAKLLSPEVVIPCHYNLWSGDTIDPDDFANLFKSTNIRPVVIPYKGSYTYKAHL